MTNAELYRQSLSSLTPSEDWRARTLAAMESAAPRPARRTPPAKTGPVPISFCEPRSWCPLLSS